MLIDLDVAKELNASNSGAQQITGTLPFIAIAVLKKWPHTYRHDLESFLYVLLWMCARQAWTSNGGDGETRPKESRLQSWEVGTLSAAAERKLADMTLPELFELILDEFRARCKLQSPCVDGCEPSCSATATSPT